MAVDPRTRREAARGGARGIAILTAYAVVAALIGRLQSDAARAVAQLVLTAVAGTLFVLWFRRTLRESAAASRRVDEERRTTGSYPPGVPESRGLLLIPIILLGCVLTFALMVVIGTVVDRLV
ncbi:hypothetical protein CLV35_3571 [Motilibacter peucedani]|uniref:Uncharacterized protein n=1 Tax=Motilibacter peucedani TaxID=598650 RepID=A0A420XLG8_9ACTN|nr:hypothetical protein [Motilibacter peucedani]RKS69393.1 hypothetical protein CLV35_3571 [Motilibacter peucedani]